MNKSLSKELRNQLARVTLAARERAENAVEAALENLAVHEKDYRPHMSVVERELRNRLRAKGRSLGDVRDERSGIQGISHLLEQAAYEQWHRLLFTRFLFENGLLYTDESFGSVPVTLKDCDELASDAGARDGFDLACRFASRTLPGVFRRDDPVLQLRLAPNDESALRELLDTLPLEVFLSDDGLGWTYQFWQSQRRKDVNDSGARIGAQQLPAVTQLFTEDYMVEFLLHNTLGAWWIGKHGPIRAESENMARAQANLPDKNGISVTWDYLRLIQDPATLEWSPASGRFPGWPADARDVTCLDPCMGSGHFLTFALPLIVRLRMEQEGTSASAATYAVLRDNLFGLELDERCAQIAAFNLALSAWKLGGYQELPLLNLACSGVALQATERNWVELGGADNDRVRNGMARLFTMFKDAPLLGSLINPNEMAGDVVEADIAELRPLLERALENEAGNDAAHEMAVTARGLAKAAGILGRRFTLVATNVPYLGRGKQNDDLQIHCARNWPNAKADLATCFVERCLALCASLGTAALITPQNWFYQGSYRTLRRRLLRDRTWGAVAQLGEEAWWSFGIRGPRTVLLILGEGRPELSNRFVVVDVSTPPGTQPVLIDEKIARLKGQETAPIRFVNQAAQLESSDAVVGYVIGAGLLSDVADTYEGLSTGDISRFIRLFWELDSYDGQTWASLMGSVGKSRLFGGREQLLFWEGGKGEFAESPGSALKGARAWGHKGLRITLMRTKAATIYTGELFDKNAGTLIPKNEGDLSAIAAFCFSAEFDKAVSSANPGLYVPVKTLLKVPFDLAHWKKVAGEMFPTGLPQPSSNDPTQWLFNGHPNGSDQVLHVAVARLLGYKWPRLTGLSFPDCSPLSSDGLETFSDADGILCLSPVNREQSAASRLRTVMAEALGEWSEHSLLAQAGSNGSKSATLEAWLRDEFFEQHCELFDDRPFVWHVWDGRKDGFHALVNYHKLDHASLKKLTYSYLGEWIRRQADDVQADKPGAADRLGAARILEAELIRILDGEAPYDIFVRWKPLTAQAVGWNPDVNDGVRVNIRPFISAADVGRKGAGLLRSKPNIKWGKDKGKEPHRTKAFYPWFWCDEEPDTDPKPGNVFAGHRWNNVHLTLDMKKAAAR